MGNEFQSVINNVIKAANENIKTESGDYIKDGLLYCHKCNTPKQCRVTFFGRVDTPMCLCKCAMQRRDEEEARQKRQRYEEYVQRLRHECFPERDMEKFTFTFNDMTNEEITRTAQNYVKNFKTFKEKGKGLLFYGDVGTGKTFTAACIANALIQEGNRCFFTNVSRVANTLSGTYKGKQEYIDKLGEYDLLVLDDFSSERNSEYINELVFNVIDSRYRTGLPLIITTNLTADEMKNASDIQKKRVYSRLYEMCFPIEVKGKDRRRKKLIDDTDTLKKLLF